jgi:predicted nucleic acid-binding Zn ribbon protein
MDKQQRDYNSTNHIADLINSTIEMLDLSEEVLSGKLIAGWPELIGENIAKHVKFFKLKNGEITLLTTSSTWRFELFTRKEEIIKLCNKFLEQDAITTMKIR